MYLYMFGMDGDTEQFAAMLEKKGFNAVVAGAFTDEQIKILNAHGLDCYTCFGSFSRGGFDDSHLCVDYNGVSREWFGSGCPSDEEIVSKRIAEVIARSANRGIKGIFSDGARYASFASPEGFEAFYTCFCPKCMARAEGYGVDLARAKELCMAGDFAAALPIMSEFRQRAISDYFARLYDEIKAADGSLTVGAFIFPSSLAPYVGQTKVKTDILAPMLYRSYPHEQGPACLNFEWNAAAESAHIAWKERGFKTTAVSDAELLRPGFEPEQVYDETAAVRGIAPLLMPIIQLEDDRLDECMKQVELAGADGCGFLAYSKENVRFLDEAGI